MSERADITSLYVYISHSKSCVLFFIHFYKLIICIQNSDENEHFMLAQNLSERKQIQKETRRILFFLNAKWENME